MELRLILRTKTFTHAPQINPIRTDGIKNICPDLVQKFSPKQTVLK